MKARRPLAVLAVTVLALGLAIPTVLAAGVASATDSFATASYSGGSGWTSNWTETGDVPGGASSGAIRTVSSGCVATSCVRFESLLGVTGTYRLSRRTNIEGATDATLSFSYKTNGLGTLSVATRSGPSEAWTEQALTASGDYTMHSMPIAADAGSGTEVRFSLSSPLLLIVAASAHIDDVSIAASYPTTTTTTTTTTPTTTSTTIASTTTPTTNEPTTTIPVVTIPPATSPTSTTVTTSVPGPTTTIAGSTTTTADDPVGPGPGGSEPSPPSGPGPGAVLPPLSGAEADLAANNNIAVDLATIEDFMRFGVNPLTNLGVKLNSTVEVITTEILSALALGGMIAFFGVRRVDDNEESRSESRS